MVVGLETGMDPRRSLHRAVSNADKDTIRDLLILHETLDVNFRDASNGLQTALMRLCHVHMEADDRCELLQLLIERGADVNLQDSSGRCALAHACIAERSDVIELISHVADCDPNVADCDGNTALIYAVRSRKPDVVKQVLDCFKGQILDVACRNNKGMSALTEAESRYDGEICRLLINEGGADPMQMDTFQFSRPYRSPRTAAAEVLPTSLPSSPRIHARQRNKKSYSFELSPVVSQNRGTPEKPVDVPSMWRENRSRSSSRSFDSNSTGDCESETSLAEVEEVDEEEEEEMLEEYGSLLKRRRNSKSLPDLREVSASLITACSPTTSPKPFNVDTYPKCGQRYERCSLTMDDVQSLPEVSEEEEDDSPPPTPPSNLDRRRDSLSLPDLRDCAFLVSPRGNHHENGDTESDSSNENENDTGAQDDDDDDDNAFVSAPAGLPHKPTNHKRLLQLRREDRDSSMKLPQLPTPRAVLDNLQHLKIDESAEDSTWTSSVLPNPHSPQVVKSPRTRRANLTASLTFDATTTSRKAGSPR